MNLLLRNIAIRDIIGAVKLSKRVYRIQPIRINGVKIVQVVIDPHYEKKHKDHINDDLILELVQRLNNRFEFPETRAGRYSYFATRVDHLEKQYRLVWLLEDGAIYIGIVNAFRDRKRRR